MVEIKLTTTRWLRASDVKNGDTIAIVSEGRYLRAEDVPFDLQGRDQIFEIDVMLPPDARFIPWFMNSTTQNRCVEAWGKETKNWIDKRVRVELKEQNVRGQMQTVIYGVPLKEAE